MLNVVIHMSSPRVAFQNGICYELDFRLFAILVKAGIEGLESIAPDDRTKDELDVKRILYNMDEQITRLVTSED